MSTFKYANTSLFYETYGSKSPVLLIHGWGIDHNYFTGCMEPIFSLFPDLFKRFYIDLPGMGKSTAGDVHNTDDILDILCAFMKEHMNSQPVLLVGNSYGGLISRAIAQIIPELVKGMILICPSSTQPHQKLPVQYIWKKDDAFLQTLTQNQRDNFCTMNVTLTKESWERYSRDIYPAVIQNQNNYFLNHILQRSLSFDLDREAKRNPFHKPVLILTGKQDSGVGYETQFQWLTLYSHATYLALEGAAHNLPIDQPEFFSSIVLNWIKANT